MGTAIKLSDLTSDVNTSYGEELDCFEEAYFIKYAKRSGYCGKKDKWFTQIACEPRGLTQKAIHQVWDGKGLDYQLTFNTSQRKVMLRDMQDNLEKVILAREDILLERLKKYIRNEKHTELPQIKTPPRKSKLRLA